MTSRVYIPFRLREGGDTRRALNLEVVQGWWFSHGYEPVIVSDFGSGDAQFNRHQAFNRAVEENPDEKVFIFTEADMLIHPDQIKQAVAYAEEKRGIVVPFKEYRYLSDTTTGFIRSNYYDMDSSALAEWWSLPANDMNSIFDMRAESTMSGGKSIGAVNVVSRLTIEKTGGFTEATSGNWYDDNITDEGFGFLSRRTRWVAGPAVHLYHLPGWTGDHLTQADRDATARNKAILESLRSMIRQGDRMGVRRIMAQRRDRGSSDGS